MPARALTIAGSDPSGGAGIQADLKTFHAFGAYGMAVVTSLTAQNTRGVTAIHDVPAAFVAEQLDTLFADVRPDATKTGMLKSAGIVEIVADRIGAGFAGRVVVDPVMIATSGDRLIEEPAVDAFRRCLFPLAAVVTPNREEAVALAGLPVDDLPSARAAGEEILAQGCEAVLVKGVLEGEACVDLLVTPERARAYRLPVLPVAATHGTGCTFSAAIAAGLAAGLELGDAVERAKGYVWRAIRDAVRVGGGSIPLNHHAPVEEESR